jgi:hypothetical protein
VELLGKSLSSPEGEDEVSGAPRDVLEMNFDRE